jgi:hypothetical protein
MLSAKPRRRAGHNDAAARLIKVRFGPFADSSRTSSEVRELMQMQQTDALLNHLVGAREERFQDRKIKQLSCFEIYDQLKFGR